MCLGDPRASGASCAGGRRPSDRSRGQGLRDSVLPITRLDERRTRPAIWVAADGTTGAHDRRPVGRHRSRTPPRPPESHHPVRAGRDLASAEVTALFAALDAAVRNSRHPDAAGRARRPPRATGGRAWFHPKPSCSPTAALARCALSRLVTIAATWPDRSTARPPPASTRTCRWSPSTCRASRAPTS